jgi:hypothetical protein
VLLAVAGVRIRVYNGFDAALDLKVKLILFTNALVLPQLDLANLPCQIDGVVGLGAGERAKGVKGLHEKVVEAVRVLLGGGSREQVVPLDEILMEFLLGRIVSALRGLILEIHVSKVGKVYIHLADSL